MSFWHSESSLTWRSRRAYRCSVQKCTEETGETHLKHVVKLDYILCRCYRSVTEKTYLFLLWEFPLWVRDEVFSKGDVWYQVLFSVCSEMNTHTGWWTVIHQRLTKTTPHHQLHTPARTRQSAQSVLEYLFARSTGLSPLKVLACISAPNSSRVLTVSRWPQQAARCSEEYPGNKE